MFDHFVNRLAAWLRRENSSRNLGTRLLACIEQRDSIVLDGDTLDELGVNQRQAIMVAYHLVMGERAHLMDDGKGKLVLMSNKHFINIMNTRTRSAGEMCDIENDRPCPVIHPATNNAEFMPIQRKTMPERKRDPWFVDEDVLTENSGEAKKR